MVRNNVNASAKTLDVAGVVDPGYSLYSEVAFEASKFLVLQRFKNGLRINAQPNRGNN